VLPYPLDGFQRKAVEKFLEGKSVVVCAPTGAGKTAIAEAAAAATLARGQRVIYTTPLKVFVGDVAACNTSRPLSSSSMNG
jgi:superfamily II RNA helicase